MTWRSRLANAGVALTLSVCGCLTRTSSLPLPPGTSLDPPVPVVAAKPSGVEERPEVARSQNPEAASHTASAVCLIDQPVPQPAEASNASPTATIRAVVSGEPILDEEVRMSCFQQMAAARTPQEQQEILKQALETLIDREVLLHDALTKLEKGGPQGAKFIQKIKEVADQEFEKHWMKPIMEQNHIETKEELAVFMKEKAHMSLDVMRRASQRSFMATEYLRSRIEPHLDRIGHTEIADYYNSHREEFTQPDSVHWQNILIDAAPYASRAEARKFAESLVRRLRAGEDFVKLSTEFDNGTSGRFRKGDGEGHKRGEIFPREAEPILFGMHDGDTEIVECSRGFHIVHLVKREYSGPIPFDSKVQKQIRDKLRAAVFMQERDRVVKELKRKAVIDPPVR